MKPVRSVPILCVAAALLLGFPTLAGVSKADDEWRVSSFQASRERQDLAGVVETRGRTVIVRTTLMNRTDCAIIWSQSLRSPADDIRGPAGLGGDGRKRVGIGLPLPERGDDEGSNGTSVLSQFEVPAGTSLRGWTLQTQVLNQCEKKTILFEFVSIGTEFFQVRPSRWDCDELKNKLNQTKERRKGVDCSSPARDVDKAEKERARKEKQRAKATESAEEKPPEHDAAAQAHQEAVDRLAQCEKTRTDIEEQIKTLEDAIRECNELSTRVVKQTREIERTRERLARSRPSEMSRRTTEVVQAVSRTPKGRDCPKAAARLAEGLELRWEADDLREEAARLLSEAQEATDQGNVEQGALRLQEAHEKIKEADRKTAEARKRLAEADRLAKECERNRHLDVRNHQARQRPRENAAQRSWELLRLIEELGIIDSSKIRDLRFKGVWGRLADAVGSAGVDGGIATRVASAAGYGAEAAASAPISTDLAPSSYLDPCTSDGAMNLLRKLDRDKGYSFNQAVRKTLELCNFMQEIERTAGGPSR